MKNLTKIASVMLALFLALCFVSCKNGPTEVASFKGTVDGSTNIITFYDDATISWVIDGLAFGGTYTGDVSKDGMGTITIDEVDGEVPKYDWQLEGNEITIGISYMEGTVTGFVFTRM